jgi:CheY-like chemotaxis protein
MDLATVGSAFGIGGVVGSVITLLLTHRLSWRAKERKGRSETDHAILVAAKRSFGPVPESAPESLQRSGSESRKRQTSDSKTPRILVVEDDPYVLELLLEYLGQRGYVVAGASSVESARAHLDHEDFDAGIFDVNLPDESGLDLLENVQASGEDMSVIIMTGKPTADTAFRALRGHAEGLLEKPFELDSLDQSLERILKRRGMSLTGLA